MAPARFSALVDSFIAGGSRSALQRELRAHGWTWSTRTTCGSRILVRAMESRWSSPMFTPSPSRGMSGAFHDALCGIVGSWPGGAERRHAASLLAMLSLADQAFVSRALVAPLEEGPLLPRILASMGPALPATPIQSAALYHWIHRLASDPDVRWVARWLSPGQSGAVRAPSARDAFFQREFAAPAPGGMAGWMAVPRLDPPALTSHAQALDQMAPPESFPGWYVRPEASAAFLRMACALPAPSTFRCRDGSVQLAAAWSVGWRPPSFAADMEGWRLLREQRPAWAAWLSSRVLSEALPLPSSQPHRLRF